MKIILCLAQTADGKIAKNSNHLADWTSKEDKKHFISLSKKHRVIIMGESTYSTIGRPLPGRLNLILTQDPEKYSSLEIPGKLQFVNLSPLQVVEFLSSKGYDSAILGGGSYTNSQFLQAKLIDEIYLTVEGLIFGEGISLSQNISQDIKLKILELKQLSPTTFLVHYQVKK